MTEAAGLPIDADLAWECGDSRSGFPVTYRVYFGAEPTPPLAGTTSSRTFALPSLAYSTSYSWRIVARDSVGETSGPVWTFTTGVEPCTAAPSAASVPVPDAGAAGVAVTTGLAWSPGASACGLPVTYSVHFGTAEPLPLLGTTAEPEWLLTPLSHETHYYWRVDTSDSNGTTAGSVWDFTTQPPPCLTLPTAPCAPSPAAGVSEVTTSVTLRWSCGDSPCGLPVTYTVRLGTTNPPPEFATVASRSLTPPFLHSGRQYYWQVSATDANGTTIGPIWDFTTKILETLQLIPVRDLLIAKEYPNANYGASRELDAQRNADDSVVHEVLLDFDLATYLAPADQILDAQLRLQASADGAPFVVHVGLAHAPSAWDERTLTWNGLYNGSEPWTWDEGVDYPQATNHTIITTFLDAGNLISFAVTDLAQWNAGLRVSIKDPPYQLSKFLFRSKENNPSNQPVLIVRFKR